MRSVSTKTPSVSSLLHDCLWPGYRPVDVRREDGLRLQGYGVLRSEDKKHPFGAERTLYV